MQLNHLDLQVRDVPATVSFFERFFGLELTSSRNSPAIAILTDGQGFTFVLQRHDAPVYPDGFHLGFLVGDVATVQEAHARLTNGGVEVSDLTTNGRGTQIYARGPDGIVVEVSCRRAK